MDNLFYKGYSIRVKRDSGGYLAIARGAGETYLDETKEEAIAGVKRKIDNIEVFQEMYNLSADTCYKCGEVLPKEHDSTVCDKCFERELEQQ